MKAVLLAGGLGTRMREETEFRPKPMVEVGGEPILVHLMRCLARHGITEFVVATGYKSEVIDEYFASHPQWQVVGRSGDVLQVQGGPGDEPWRAWIAYTGESTGTGGRVKRITQLLAGERFFVTYGDGLADVDVSGLLDFHLASGGLATLTAVQPTSRFGLMDIDLDGRVTHFREKPKMKDWVSIGFFIFEPAVLDYLSDDCGLEEEGLTPLAAGGHLRAFRHDGFWQPMDTYREYCILQRLWESGEAPWRSW
jgi:glucose-1-phosphate cytidylyltransferase